MTDTTISLVIALDKEIRVDDVQPIIDAISMIKRVIGVKINVWESSDEMNAYAYRSQFMRNFQNKIFDMIDKELR